MYINVLYIPNKNRFNILQIEGYQETLILKDTCTSFLMFCQTVWTCISFKRARWSGSVYAEFITFNRITVLKNIGKTQI